jgi:DNA-binding CsgD family transcriptional regulator
MSTRGIGDIAGLAGETVGTYKKRIFKRLRVRGRSVETRRDVD